MILRYRLYHASKRNSNLIELAHDVSLEQTIFAVADSGSEGIPVAVASASASVAVAVAVAVAVSVAADSAVCSICHPSVNVTRGSFRIYYIQ